MNNYSAGRLPYL